MNVEEYNEFVIKLKELQELLNRLVRLSEKIRTDSKRSELLDDIKMLLDRCFETTDVLTSNKDNIEKSLKSLRELLTKLETENAESKTVCPNCCSVLEQEAVFCNICGCRVDEMKKESSSQYQCAPLFSPAPNVFCSPSPQYSAAPPHQNDSCAGPPEKRPKKILIKKEARKRKTDASHGFECICGNCGSMIDKNLSFCPACGFAVKERSSVRVDKVQFSAVVPKNFVKGDYSDVNIVMFEEAYRHIVDSIKKEADAPTREVQSGIFDVGKNAEIRIVLTSSDIDFCDEDTMNWNGGYLNFTFAVNVPENYKKHQILFSASVYINGIIATRLKFTAKCFSLFEQKMSVVRNDVVSAFISYASGDRARVASIIQGMQKARPDMDIFFDVESLRSGDDWEKALHSEIERRDVFYLCWSSAAKESKWVDFEWRYALENKGIDCIEPVPIDPPDVCPPPDELVCKHFNDKLIYFINR